MRKCLWFLWTLTLAGAAAAQTAGKVERVLPAGFLTHDKQTSEAKPADPVFWNDILRTNEKGRMRVGLADGSVVSVGAKAEMRVVKHDTESQQTVIELLYGKARANVAPLTKPNSSFQVRTPTAVIGAIGTSAVIETMAPTSVTTVDRETLENLPGPRSFQSLLDLAPGAMPPPKSAGGAVGGPSIADYYNVDATRVVAIDHVTGVRNIDPEILKTVYVLPGEYTIVRRGQPPTDPMPFEDWSNLKMGDIDPPFRTGEAGAPDCVSGLVINGIIASASDPSLVGKPIEYLMTGRGTGSTGNVLTLKTFNPTSCPLDFMIPEGSVFVPEGMSAALGKLTASDFQHMMGFGGSHTMPFSGRFGAKISFFTAPPAEAVEIPLRAYCLEREKLAPHPNTKYRFATPAQQQVFAHNREFISRAHQMFLDGALAPTQPLDLIIQWAIWTAESKFDEKRFREAHTKLVEKALKEQGRKFDKEMKARVEAAQADIWANVQKLLATKPPN